jgi:hypothetical protein
MKWLTAFAFALVLLLSPVAPSPVSAKEKACPSGWRLLYMVYVHPADQNANYQVCYHDQTQRYRDDRS